MSRLGGLVFILVLSIISSVNVRASFINNPGIIATESNNYPSRDPITLEESMLGELSANQFASQWLPSDPTLGRDELLFEDSKNIKLASMPSCTNLQLDASNSSILFSKFLKNIVSESSVLVALDYQGFRLSPSKRYLLIWTSKRRHFRHSSTAKYLIFDIELNLIALLSTRSLKTGEPTQANSYHVFDKEGQQFTTQNYVKQNQDEFTQFQHVRWFSLQSSDSNASQDSLILIQDNDIYLLSNLTSNQSSADVSKPFDFSPIRLTYTGESNEISNGLPDWLYEEEILGDRPAYEFSPNGSNLAFMSFNDSLVDEMPFSVFGDQLIPKVKRIKYPKAGRVNPRVSINLVTDLANLLNGHQKLAQNTTKSLVLPTDLAKQQHYITQIKWLSNDKLALVWLNRIQNESLIIICSSYLGWSCEKNLALQSIGGWLEMTDDLIPYNNEFYLTLLYRDTLDPAVGSRKQIAKVSLDGSNNFTFITDIIGEVTAISGIDRQTSVVYFTATPQAQPGQRQIYWINMPTLNDANLDSPKCLTCDHYIDECLYNNIKMSPSTSYYLFECDGPGVPRVELRFNHVRHQLNRVSAITSSTTLVDDSTQNLVVPNPIWQFENNQALRDKLTRQKILPFTMRLTIPIANTSYSADVLLLLPPQLERQATFRPFDSTANRSSRSPMGGLNAMEQPFHVYFTPETIAEYSRLLAAGQQFPMVVEVYAGPGTQHVDFRYKLGFGHYLASSHRTIYAIIDGRGSGFQGTKRMYEVYHRLGSVEIQDQIDVVAHLARTYSFIDANRVAIWGWSYGGYAAAMALAQSVSLSKAELAKLGTGNYSGSNIGPGARRRLANLLLGRTSHEQPVSRAGVFQCAASVAPVTDWLLYDTAYTERYMSSPYLNDLYDENFGGDHVQQNTAQSMMNSSVSNQKNEEFANGWIPSNLTSAKAIANDFREASQIQVMPELDSNARYRQSSLLDKIVNIGTKRFLLVHGTADDNVHFQQSIMLMKRLIQRNVMFQTRLYPDQDHSIGNRADKLHLGSSLSNFFAECFDLTF